MRQLLFLPGFTCCMLDLVWWIVRVAMGRAFVSQMRGPVFDSRRIKVVPGAPLGIPVRRPEMILERKTSSTKVSHSQSITGSRDYK